MIKIGVVNIDTSHPQGFSEYLLRDSRARYAAVYNAGFREDDEVEAFIKKHGLEKRCKSLEELADFSDIGFIQGCNWDKHIEYALPFIERKKPVFIDKPVAGNPADCAALEKLSSGGAVILGSSSLRYSDEIIEFANAGDEERGKILNVFGTAGVDEFSYGVHIVEGIGGLLGEGAVSNRFAGRSSIGGKTCETFFIRYASGITAIYNNFHGQWQPFELVVMTTKSTYSFRIDTGKIYKALLDRICRFMETGANELAQVSALTESVRIMLAGKVSRESNGVEIMLKDIPADYPGFDGSKFEREYAGAARKIYL